MTYHRIGIVRAGISALEHIGENIGRVDSYTLWIESVSCLCKCKTHHILLCLLSSCGYTICYALLYRSVASTGYLPRKKVNTK
jgi:hypothetical protein